MNNAYRVVAFAAFALVACNIETQDSEQALDNFGGNAFADVLDEQLLTTIEVGNNPGSVVFDASAGRPLFPMPRGVRAFESFIDVVEFVASVLGAQTLEAGQEGGFLLHYTLIGDSYWVNTENGALYVVSDPIAAFIGGVSGAVEIAGQQVCVDGRVDCSEGLAAYLQPVDYASYASVVHKSNDSNTVQYHSFYNRFDICFMKYARHGGNTTVTRGETSYREYDWRICEEDEPGAFHISLLGYPDVDLYLCTEIEDRELELHVSSRLRNGWSDWSIGSVTASDVSSVEVGVAGSTGGFFGACAPEFEEYSATAVRSRHRATGLDDDHTENGP